MLCTNYHVFEVTRQHFLWKKNTLLDEEFANQLLYGFFDWTTFEHIFNTNWTRWFQEWWCRVLDLRLEYFVFIE